MTPPPAEFLESFEARLLGVCPQCGCAVAATADALRYKGAFHHITCVLARRERMERMRAPWPPRS
jgi:hypothetical protein